MGIFLDQAALDEKTFNRGVVTSIINKKNHVTEMDLSNLERKT